MNEIPSLRQIPNLDEQGSWPPRDWITVRPRRPGRECQDCEAFVLFCLDPGPGSRDNLEGQCRRRSPDGHSPGFHPLVSAQHWCLEFRGRLQLDALATMGPTAPAVDP